MVLAVLLLLSAVRAEFTVLEEGQALPEGSKRLSDATREEAEQVLSSLHATGCKLCVWCRGLPSRGALVRS